MHPADEVVAEARTWLGTPFRHQGRVKGEAGDCLGIVACVGKEKGGTDYDTLTYGRRPNPRRMSRLLGEHLVRIAVGEAGPADVLHMAWGSLPMHLAIVTDVGILHAWEGAGRCVEHPLDFIWRSRIRAAYRFPALARWPS